MPAASQHPVRSQFDLASIKRWRTIQVAALLPLSVCVALMFYYRTASGLGMVCFFLLIVFGILVPEMKADIVQSHLILQGEQEELKHQLQKLLREEPDSAKEE